MKRFFIYLPLLFLLMITSCEDNSSEIDYNPNVLSAKDYIRAEDAIFEIVNAFLKGVHDTLVMQTGYGYIDHCDVAYSAAENSITYSYGDVNRLCGDDKFRRGMFKATFTGPIFEEGTSAQLLTDSLFVDDYLVEAGMIIENTGLNASNKIAYDLNLTSSDIHLPDTSKTIGVNLSADFVLAWHQGSATPEIHEDDIFLVTGSASGTSTDNYVFSIEIQDPLENHLDCRWISSGISRITVPVSQFPSGMIDYIISDGCNNYFYFYFNENQFFDQIK